MKVATACQSCIASDTVAPVPRRERTDHELAERLRDPATAAVYVNERLATPGKLGTVDKALLAALADVVRALGIDDVATRAGVKRPNVYRVLRTDPRLGTLVRILKGAHLRLTVEPAAKATARKRKRSSKHG